MRTSNTIKTLMLAGLGALSIGVGSAMASGSGAMGPDYWAAQQQAQLARQAAANPKPKTQIWQYGSSDVEQPILNQGLDAVAGGF